MQYLYFPKHQKIETSPTSASKRGNCMSTQSTSTVLILGSRGRLGAALVRAFHARGWQVLQQARDRSTEDGDNVVDADARNAEAVLTALRNRHAGAVDVVINACNPVYTRWATEALPLNTASIAIARALNATLIFPGNVYNFGADMGESLTRDTAQRAKTRKGLIRITMEQQLANAVESGLQSIIIRAGDYFGCTYGSWFDLAIAKDLHRGKITSPGPLNVSHAWAYVPDLAETFVNVAEARSRLAQFERIHFAGHTVTTQTMIDAISKLTQRSYKVGTLPWPIIRTFSFAVPMWRQIAELAYLWQRPHQLISAPEHLSLTATQTPFDDAVRQSVASLHPSLLTA
jgi:nucleoside-diphosphate-sugar epimerase